jgi:hypothetical protein
MFREIDERQCAAWACFHEEERAEEAAAWRRAELEAYNEEKCKKIAAARLFFCV